MSWPIPVGITASFPNVRTDSVATSNFTMDGGFKVVTFQPVNPGNPGIAYLYDSSNTLRLTMTEGGNYMFQVSDAGETFYFKATLGANILAMTTPNHPNRWN